MEVDDLATLYEGRLKVWAHADAAGFDYYSLEATRQRAENRDAKADERLS